MNFPPDLYYSKEHTWLKIEGDTGIIGITAFAQSELGEIVYADLPDVGKNFGKDEVFGSVEAVKTTSDLFMPVGGEVLEVNGSLKENAEPINSDPYSKGWMIKIRLSNPNETDTLMRADQYPKLMN